MPPSATKLLQLLPESVPVSRVSVADERSRPAPPSEPLPRLKVTEPPLKYGASGPVSVIVCPLGPVVSSVIVIVSFALLPALSVAVMIRPPGLVALFDQLLSVPVVDQPLTAERSG